MICSDNDVAISSTLHSILNTIRGIIRYRDEDLDDLSDDEICGELAVLFMSSELYRTETVRQ
jgi:citrate synthase